MSHKDKKLAVLQLLRREVNPIGLSDLLSKLGEGFSERSVRRWLSELLVEGSIEKEGQKRGTKYWAKIASDKIGGVFSSDSLKSIEKVRRPVYERYPVVYSEDWVTTYQPNETYYISEPVRDLLFKAGKRSKLEDPAGTYAHQIFNRLLIDLSYNSSRLEGNTYSLLDTQRLLLEGTGAEGKLDEEKIMILNHKEAIRYLVDSAHRLVVNTQAICTLHYLLADGLLEPRLTGKVRDHAVRVGGSTYIPFEDSKRLQLLLDLITDKAAKIRDPYEQSLFLLVHISYAQAFSDVNKRTARISSNIPLVTHNLVPLSFNDVERDDYNSALVAIYEFQDVRPLVELYVFSYLRTCAVYDSTVQVLGFDEVRVRFRAQRRALIRNIIVMKLVGSALQDFISSQASLLIGDIDRKAFIEDVQEDLDQIDQSRIIGLGITPDQLNEWLFLYRS